MKQFHIIEKVYGDNYQNYLFPASEMYLASHHKNGKSYLINQISSTNQKMLGLFNLNLLVGTRYSPPISLPVRFPEIKAYNGTTDFEMVPFSRRKRYLGKNIGVHFFEYDFKFANQLNNNLDSIIMDLLKVPLVVAPDFSMHVGTDDILFNILSKWSSMIITNRLQRYGINVVPLASWSDVNSLKWAFHGLPTHSIIAVCGVGHSRHQATSLLWNYALHELEKQLQPTKLLIYGPETKIPGLHTQTQFISDYISTHFRK